MAQPSQGGSFEPYPWTNPDEPRPSGDALLEAPPSERVQPEQTWEPPAPMPQPVRYVAPQMPPPRPPGVSRRGVLGVVAGLAGLAVFGGIVVGARPTPSVDAEPSAWASRVVEEPVEETQGASLQTTDGDLYLDVPADWQIVNEGDLLLLSGSDGAYRVAARVPEVPRGTENDLRREAEYLRDGFEATGKPAFTDESTRQYDILRMQTPGTFSGEEVVEQVTYLVEPERSRGLVVSLLLPASPTPSEGRAARGMVDDLLRLFKEL